MRTSRSPKVVAAAAVVVALLSTLASPAPAVDGEVSGSMTLHYDPPYVVEFPAEEDDPCEEEAGYTFSAEADGDATEGTITLDTTIKEMFPQPGSIPVAWHQFDMSVIYQDLTYSLANAGPPTWTYAIEGEIAFQIDIVDVPGAPADCTKQGVLCSFGVLLGAVGEVVQGVALDPIAAGATASVSAASEWDGIPLTYLGGDCAEYAVLDGLHVSLDLAIAF